MDHRSPFSTFSSLLMVGFLHLFFVLFFPLRRSTRSSQTRVSREKKSGPGRCTRIDVIKFPLPGLNFQLPVSADSDAHSAKLSAHFASGDYLRLTESITSGRSIICKREAASLAAVRRLRTLLAGTISKRNEAGRNKRGDATVKLRLSLSDLSR